MKIKHILTLVLSVIFMFSCNKDPEEKKDYNMLKVTSGSISGFTYTFSPNRGFWAEVSATARYVHLVFGDTDNLTVSGQDVMSILFYHEGGNTVTIPSAQGQHVNFGITADGSAEYYSAGNVTFTIQEFTDTRLIGFMSGECVNNSTSETVNISMDIDIDMTQLAGR